MKKMHPLPMIVAALVLSVVGLPLPVFSQANFYQGKTVKVINNDPGGISSLRVRVVMKYLTKYVPGNPAFMLEIIEGGGGRSAANQVYQKAKPDGLTLGALASSIVGLHVMRESGVMYDIDKFIHLGTPVSENHNVIYTRSVLGFNSLEKLRAASGLKLGAQDVGGGPYISARLFAYFLDLKTPKFVTGYSGLEADVALNNGEIDSRSNNVTSVLTRNRDWIDKGIMDFHALLAVPKNDRPTHPKLAQLPEIETFAKTDRERKLLAMWRSFRIAAIPFVLPPGTPKDRVEIMQEALRKTFKDSEFRAEFKKVAMDDATPLMPEELTKIIHEMPRDPEVIDLLKRMSGTEPLPARQ